MKSPRLALCTTKKSDMLAFSMALGYGHVVALMMMASLVPMMPEKSTNSTLTWDTDSQNNPDSDDRQNYVHRL